MLYIVSISQEVCVSGSWTRFPPVTNKQIFVLVKKLIRKFHGKREVNILIRDGVSTSV